MLEKNNILQFPSYRLCVLQREIKKYFILFSSLESFCLFIPPYNRGQIIILKGESNSQTLWREHAVR